MKKIITIVLSAALCIAFAACGEAMVPQTEYEELQAVNAELQDQINELNNQLSDLEQKAEDLENQLDESNNLNQTLSDRIDDLENGPAALIVSIRNASESKNWEEVVKLAEDLHSRANGSPEDEEGQKLATTAQKEIEKAEAQRAAEEAKGYETGITYDQVSRNPEEYKNEKVTFRGQVFQSFVDGSDTIIMMAVGGSYNSTMYVTIPSSSLEARILENDWIIVRGLSNGLYTYESAGRGMLSVPWVKADIIER